MNIVTKHQVKTSFLLLLFSALVGCTHQKDSVSPDVLDSGYEDPSSYDEESEDDIAALPRSKGSDDKIKIGPGSIADLKFDWPVDEARMTRGFIPERRKRKRPHWGIDLAGPRGTDIFASHPGTVIYCGKSFKGYGKMILVENQDGWATLYAHLSGIGVRQGDTVDRGQKIGAMGNTGRSTGNHLHFEIRKDRRPIDPLEF